MCHISVVQQIHYGNWNCYPAKSFTTIVNNKLFTLDPLHLEANQGRTASEQLQKEQQAQY